MADPCPKPTTFDAILRERKSPFSDALARHLDEIRVRATEDWMDFLGEDKGSRNGYVHLRNVERNADKMVPLAAKYAFSDGEIFLLLASILLHDVGKIVPDTVPIDYGHRTDSFRQWGFRCPRKGWGHHCASKRLIDEQWAVFGLPDSRIAGYCGLLAYTHNIREPLDAVATCLCDTPCILDYPKNAEYRSTSLEPYGILRIPLLAAILRIADETENHWTRALRTEAHRLYLKSGRNLAKAFRRHIEDVEFCPEGHCIIMHVPRIDEGDADAEYLLLESLAISGKNAENVVKAWGTALKPTGAVYEHVLFEHAGHLYHDPSQGFGNPPALVDVFPEDREFIEVFLGKSAELAKGTSGYQKIPLSSIEASMGVSFGERHRWLIARIGDAHDGLHIEKDITSGYTRVSLDSSALPSICRTLGVEWAKTSHTPTKWLDRGINHAFQTIAELSRGTFGHRRFSWSAIEAAIGHRLTSAERGAIRKLSGIHEGFKIELGPQPGDIDVNFDGEKYAEIRAALEGAWNDPQGFRAAKLRRRTLELYQQLHRLWLMTGGIESFSWQSVEAHLGAPMNQHDREVLKSIEVRWGIWRVTKYGLQGCCQDPTAWSSALADLIATEKEP